MAYVVTGDPERDEHLTKTCDRFMEEHEPMQYANGCGIGIGSSENTEIGISLYFETKKDMDAFPFKGDRYQGLPVYRKVIGTIRAL